MINWGTSAIVYTRQQATDSPIYEIHMMDLMNDISNAFKSLLKYCKILDDGVTSK